MNKPITARLRAKNQITIPKEIRELLDVDTGDTILFTVHDNIVIVWKGKTMVVKP